VIKNYSFFQSSQAITATPGVFLKRAAKVQFIF